MGANVALFPPLSSFIAFLRAPGRTGRRGLALYSIRERMDGWPAVGGL